MHPMLGMGMALQRLGHAVSFAANPVHSARIQACGLDYRALGTQVGFEATADDPALWDPRTAMSVFWRGLRNSLEALPEAALALPARQPATLLVHPLLLPAAALARARRPGLRVVAAWLAPQNLRTCHDPMMVGPLRIPRWLPMALRRRLWQRVDRRFIDPAPLPELNAARQALGLAPVPHFMPHLQAVADQSITLFPPWFARTAPDWPQPMLRGSFPLFEPPGSGDLPAEVQAFLVNGTAPVVVTLGTFQRHGGAMLTQVVQAARALGRRTVVLAAEREQLALPPAADLLWQPYLPLQHLLPLSAALVHHGGIGTTAEALHAGVPQLVLPWAFDQFDNAQRVRTLGVGLTLPSRRLRPDPLRRALSQLLDSSAMAGACQSAAERVRADPGLDELCRQLMHAIGDGSSDPTCANEADRLPA
ncbi:MAG: nucleotide disphospho-sugar-binding domain-containing protein [Burkholderiales bacterium]